MLHAQISAANYRSHKGRLLPTVRATFDLKGRVETLKKASQLVWNHSRPDSLAAILSWQTQQSCCPVRTNLQPSCPRGAKFYLRKKSHKHPFKLLKRQLQQLALLRSRHALTPCKAPIRWESDRSRRGCRWVRRRGGTDSRQEGVGWSGRVKRVCDLLSVCRSGEEAVIMRRGTSRETSGTLKLQTQRQKGTRRTTWESQSRCWDSKDETGSGR